MLLSDWRNKLNVVLFKLTELSDSFRILQSNDSVIASEYYSLMTYVLSTLCSIPGSTCRGHLLRALAEGTC